jgi:HAE1 family hydrophobic/amphiphilic exporter-1
MSRLSELALAKRSVTLLLAGALFIAGVGAWGSLKQELLPDIEFPVITVIVPLPGAGAADVAEQVTKPVERAISGVPRLEGMQSTSANSLALVVAQFEYGTDVKATLAQIEQNLQGAGLPQTVEPQVSALNINASPVVIASIVANSEDQFADAARIVQDEIAPELLAIEGVASVDVTGGEEQRVLVTLYPDELAANGISAAQVTGVLAANNLTFPSGQIRDDSTNTPVSTIGTFGSIEEIESLVVGVATPPTVPAVPGVPAAPVPGASAAPGAPAAPAAPVMPQPVTIGDLGSVEIAGVATTGYAFTGTPETEMQPSLSVSVSKTSSANTVDVAAAVDAKLKELGDANADTVTVVVVSDLSSFIIESRDGLLKEGGLGALFAILTIFLFLASLRSTIVAAVSIPLSLLAALVLMQLTGITINIMTLGGLAVAIGRVVDDAIVVLENIYRHRALGDDRMTAALKGPREVAGAITSATVTTVLVFLPLGFVGGLVSQFFLPFALTVTFALLASLVCALTVVPVLAYLLIDKVKLNVDEDGEPRNSFWIRAYTPTIKLALRDRWTKWGVLLGSVVLFAATGSSLRSCPPSSSTRARRTSWG